MSQSHSLFSYLERQNSDILQVILLQELNRRCQQNTPIILKILYLLEARCVQLPPHIMEAWDEYLHHLNII